MRATHLTAVIALVLGMALPASAQDVDGKGPLTWIAYSKIRPGTVEKAAALSLENRALMDELVAGGTVLSWGIAVPVNHSPGDTWNYVDWVTVADWAGLETWFDRFMQKQRSMDETERAELEARAKEIRVEGSHFDEIVRHAVFRADRDAAPMRYLYAGEFRAKPGQGSSMITFFREMVVPMVDRMVADGVLTAYGVYTPDLHVDAPWTHRFWYGLPDLASIEKMQRGFEEGASPAMNAWIETVFETEGHYDKVLMVLHTGAAN